MCSHIHTHQQGCGQPSWHVHMFAHVAFEAALRCLLWKCWTLTPLSGSQSCCHFCPACRLVWGHMTPGGGVLSYTVTLMLAHHRSALILACTHLLISCTLRAVARLLFCHARLTFVPLMCVSAFKNTLLQRVPGWGPVTGDPVCVDEGGLRGDQRFVPVADTCVCSSWWRCSEEMMLMVERSSDQQACLFFRLVHYIVIYVTFKQLYSYFLAFFFFWEVHFRKVDVLNDT